MKVRRDYLFTERLVGGAFNAANVETMWNDRFSERIEQSQQSFSH